MDEKKELTVTPEATTVLFSGKMGNPRKNLLIVTPTLGIVRMEWAIGRYGQAMPCNWTAASATLGIGNVVPMHYLVADAQNLGCEEVINKGYEWLLLWEDDVIPPFDALLRLNIHIKKGDIPIVSGLYFTKGIFSEPILYRGNGGGCFEDFKMGELVWASGVPTGFLLIHSSIIKLMWEESPEYATISGRKTREVFKTVAQCFYDPETQAFSTGSGTSDLVWCNRVIEENVLERAGWAMVSRKEFPFLCDTRIFCKHIDLATGEQFPGFNFNAVDKK
jgi:hypothetical protein